MKTTIALIALLAISILSVGVTGQSAANYVEGDFALSEARPQSCQTIIDTSRFYGTCCSLSTTASGGCVLNVKNGWCRIAGQFWGKTWNSTDDSITCDPSEFEITYTPTNPPTAAPVNTPGDTCDALDEEKKVTDCFAANGCNDDVGCAQSMAQIEFDSSKINDICAYVEPGLCVVDACCSPCGDEYRNLMACTSQGSVAGCTDLNCPPINHVDSSASSMATSLAVTALGLAIANFIH
mmetsp:Transcript_31877/g.77267  ORF Transcript_31877/g.77267 Transcript_31877/m.77267 type:complete len:238 (-) Transcript_31877:1161-1874(-)